MSQPFVGEIRLVGFNFAPVGWALCNGQILSISQNSALFDLIGTTYGGNGVTDFALPNLQGLPVVHEGNSYVIGETGGAESVTVTVAEMASHNHPINYSSSAATSPSPAGMFPGLSAIPSYANGPEYLLNYCLAGTGLGKSHENRQPFLVLNYIISLFGIFPSQ